MARKKAKPEEPPVAPPATPSIPDESMTRTPGPVVEYQPGLPPEPKPWRVTVIGSVVDVECAACGWNGREPVPYPQDNIAPQIAELAEKIKARHTCKRA